MDIKKLDASTLAEMIKNKEISAEEAVRSSIEKIEEKNPSYNAVIGQRFEEAIKESQKLRDLSKAFSGVPILLKDLGHDLMGLTSTSGSNIFKGRKAQSTSNFTKSVLDAGFIVLGSTNVPEFGLKFISDSKLYGPVKNPVNTLFNAGGSSGGAAAAVQGALVPTATASDGGGSIRIPASFTGLIGLKPTRGRTSTGPGKWRSWAGAAVGFFMTKTMLDTEKLLLSTQADLKPMPFNVSKLTSEQIQESKANLKKLKIAFSRTLPDGKPLAKEALRAVEKTVKFLEDQGFEVFESCPQIDFDSLSQGYLEMNAAETANSFRNISQSLKRDIRPEELEPMTYAVGYYGRDVKAMDYTAILDQWDRVGEIFHNFHKEYDVFIHPTTALPAAPIEEKTYGSEIEDMVKNIDSLSREEIREAIENAYRQGFEYSPFAYIYNLTGQPAISLPLHTCENGMPLGVQLAADKGREDILLALGTYLEERGQLNYY